jgi:hypothetical protein
MKKSSELLQMGGKFHHDRSHVILPTGEIYERTTKNVDGWNWQQINEINEIEVKTNLHPMCADCEHLGADCIGADPQPWTGCISRKSDKSNYQESSRIPVMSREHLETHGVAINELPKLGE